MLSNTGYESWENPPEEYEEPYFDEGLVEEIRYLKKYPEEIPEFFIGNDLPF